MGRIEEARDMLETAFKKDDGLREVAETDEDLPVIKVPVISDEKARNILKPV